MKIFAVIDTNVLVSAVLKWDSVPGLVVEKAVTGKITPVLSDEIISEYDEVLHRKKFNFSDDDIRTVIQELKLKGIFLRPSGIEEVLPDEKDIVFYAVTMEARKENSAYLVTGNIKHFPVKPYVVTPREFLTILENIQA
ncbi:MAG: putative toxin-antitoxin system toxin component, PIN family [Synergistaceae bacterium]|nr:putative toxin-antitoxin system toxin component, PIN family [Synergistaceae bacterium]